MGPGADLILPSGRTIPVEGGDKRHRSDLGTRTRLLIQPIRGGQSNEILLRKPNGSVWTTETAPTGADGWALFSMNTVKNNATGTYTINVTGVSKSGATYDPGANVKSSTTSVLQ
jgi:hypothetical protein